MAESAAMTARLFTLERDVDATGVSGVGTVAEGCVFDDGHVELRWLRWPRSTGFYPSIEGVVYVHCHHGQTRIVWVEP